MIKNYFNLYFKNSFKNYPLTLIITFITIVSVLLGCYGGFQKTFSSDENQKIKVGVVGNKGETFFGVGISAIKNIDTSRFSIELIDMTEDEAKRELLNNNIFGYVNIPDDYIKNILNGKNISADYIVRKGSVNFGALLTSEIVDSISELITKSQQSIYAMRDVSRKYNKEDMEDNTYKINMNYISLVFSRANTFDIQNLGIKDSVSTLTFYICSVFILLIFLWGISTMAMFQKNDYSINSLLKSKGLKSFWQVISEYFCLIIITYLTIFIFTLSGIIFIYAFGLDDFLSFDIVLVFLFIIKSVPCTLMILSFILLVNEFIQNMVARAMLILIFALLTSYLSGFFYPSYFFSDSLINFMELLPSGSAFSYLRKSVSGLDFTKDLLVILAYNFAFILISVFKRNKNLLGGIK